MQVLVALAFVALSTDRGGSLADEVDLIVPESDDGSLAWWTPETTKPLLDRPQWVAFDLQTILLDTLINSPRIQGVSRQTSIALERIVQQDAAFDPNVLLESRGGRKNDPVGNVLTTGGPPRLLEDSFTARAGVEQTGRRGTAMNLSQELGTLNSNSQFFSPNNQGNARLNLSLTQPLLGRGGQVYNERLLTQARIDGRLSWQEMRGEVEQQIADVVSAYWQLYELRCHLIQARGLLEQSRAIETVLLARQEFDVGNIEMAKARGRVAKRLDRVVQLQAEVKKQQVRLARLVGSDELIGAGDTLELIPKTSVAFPKIQFELREAVLQGVENRPEVRAAAMAMESAALSIHVTRTELVPELTAVIDGYLAGLNGQYGVFNSFADQFSTGGPGLSGGLRYDLPYGRRAARSRVREANHRYQQKSQELREAIQLTRAEVEIAMVNVNTSLDQRATKSKVLETASEEETILTMRWEMMAGDGGNVGVVLENLLDAQQRRSEAEREFSSSQSQYLTSIVELQRAMGTLLRYENIEPIQTPCDNTIEFTHPHLSMPLEGLNVIDSPSLPRPDDQMIDEEEFQ